MQFQDDLAAGVVLVRPALQSPNYVAGVSGFAIKLDGSAEFNNAFIRGATTSGGQALYYNGTPAAGNLILSISGAAGSDTFGNAYVKGLGAYGAAGQIIAKDAAGDTATLAGNIGGGGTLAAMPGLAMQPVSNVGGDPATIGALDPGTHTDFSLLLTSPSAVVGGIPGTDYSQINMIGKYGGPAEINVDAGVINFNSGATIDSNGVFTSYGFDSFNTYTPTVTNGGGATFSTRTGWYMKIGKMVYVNAYIVVNVAGSGTGIVGVSMPSSVDRTTRQALTVHGETIGVAGNGATLPGQIRGGECVFFTGGSGATSDRIRVDDSDGDGEGNVLGADLKTNALITVQGWYREA